MLEVAVAIPLALLLAVVIEELGANDQEVGKVTAVSVFVPVGRME